jgi:hypothetical protein
MLQTQAILDEVLLNGIADNLQQNSTVLDVVNAYDSYQKARAEWNRILDGVANELNAVPADPIVQQVLQSDLDNDERQFGIHRRSK